MWQVTVVLCISRSASPTASGEFPTPVPSLIMFLFLGRECQHSYGLEYKRAGNLQVVSSCHQLARAHHRQ